MNKEMTREEILKEIDKTKIDYFSLMGKKSFRENPNNKEITKTVLDKLAKLNAKV